MFRRVRFDFVSDNGVAWAIAGGAVVLLLALPPMASAQSGAPAVQRQAPIKPNEVTRDRTPSATAGRGVGTEQNNGPAGIGGQPSQHKPTFGNAGHSPKTDILDLRDKNISLNLSVTETHDTTLQSPGGIVCIAGCDRASAASLKADQRTQVRLSLVAQKPVDLRTEDPPLACIAGCYEPVVGRTVASLSAQQPMGRGITAKLVPANGPILSQNVEAPNADLSASPLRQSLATAENARAPDRLPVTRSNRVNRSATKIPSTYRQPSLVPAVQKTRRTKVAKLKTPYGKVVLVKHSNMPSDSATPSQQQKLAAPPASPMNPPGPVEALATVAKPADEAPAPASPVVRKAATPPQVRPPLASTSNDWFNRINRERKAAAASGGSGDKSTD